MPPSYLLNAFFYFNLRAVSSLLLLAILTLLTSAFVQATEPTTRFEHLSLEDGLSQGTVTAITQDNTGFLWFATEDGLNRFDGYEFKVYRHNPSDSHSISNNMIRTIYQDHQGILWVGTDIGLNRFDAHTDQFTRFTHLPQDPTSLSFNRVWTIFEDDRDNFWVGTGNGLNRLDRNTSRFEHFRQDDTKTGAISHNAVYAIAQDKAGTLWVGTHKGLNRFDYASQTFVHFYQTDDSSRLSRNNINNLNNIKTITEDAHGLLWIGTRFGLNHFDKQTGQFHRFIHDTSTSNSLVHNSIRSAHSDKSGALWIGTEGGLNRYDQRRQLFSRFNADSSNPYSLNHNTVHAIFEDKNDILWIGTGKGINKYNTATRHLNHFKHNKLDTNGLSAPAVSSFLQDKQNRLWVGTWDGGLNLYNNDTRTFKVYREKPLDERSLLGSSVQTIFQDSKGQIWVGTIDGGLNLYQEKTADFIRFKPDASTPDTSTSGSLSHPKVSSIIEDKRGALWVSTLGGGLNRYNQQNNQFEHFKHNDKDTNSLANNLIATLFEDVQGFIWIGTYDGGLDRFDPTTKRFEHFVHDANQANSLSNNAITSIHQDNNDQLWIGTNGGLNRFNPKNKNFTRYLPTDVINGVTSDHTGLLWFSTNRGLFRFDSADNLYHRFDVNDGLQSNEFNLGAVMRANNGELFFGGINGFNRFFPAHITPEAPPSKLVLTDFLLFNQSVPVGKSPKDESLNIHGSYRLSRLINSLDSITLDHRHSLFTFEFAALSFVTPDKNRYAYMLQGWDKDWIYTDAKNRRATYTNIPSGDYTLRIKAGNQYGHWSEQSKSLEITVNPPLWDTWWAYLLYCLIVLSIVVLAYQNAQQKRLLTLRNQTKIIDNERAMNQRLKQFDKLKDEFLANTSHELRTPLNGITGLAESLIDGVAGQLPRKANHNLAMIIASGKRLSNLVNDILDFSTLKNHNLTLNTKPVDLQPLVEVVLALLRPLADKKSLRLINDIPSELPAILADENRLQQILHNLTGNAIKFTDEGQVIVSAQVIAQELQINVTDTGIGIELDKQAQIFDSFEQIDSDNNRTFGGTGLGLAICKQLVTLHGGQIEVDSQLDYGSVFSFTLPTCDQIALSNEATLDTIARLQPLPQNVTVELLSDDEAEQYYLESKIARSNQDNQRFRLLLVDDEPVNLQVLHDHLSLQNYQLVQASSGKQALKLLKEESFDLVLLDVMMPQISGFDVCQQLRETHSVNDLPVIFLTAKNQVTDLVHSFAVGANDYLTKPVAKHELLARVETHLKLLDVNRNLELRVSQRTQQLIQAKKMASLGTLTAGFAHEINNPNNFVSVSTQNLQVDLDKLESVIFELAGDDTDEAVLNHFKSHFAPLHLHLSTIQTGAERIKNIVKDLQTFTHQGSGDLNLVNITQNLQSTINLIKTKHLNVVEFATDFIDYPDLLCYPGQLNQVFMQLMLNGCDAIFAKQQQQAEHTPSDDDKLKPGLIVIACRLVDGNIEIKFTDNGCGMTQEVINQLFDPFFTTKDVGQGTGLGLSIAYNIVRQHQGELSYSSTPDVGTVCTLLLPQIAQ